MASSKQLDYLVRLFLAVKWDLPACKDFAYHKKLNLSGQDDREISLLWIKEFYSQHNFKSQEISPERYKILLEATKLEELDSYIIVASINSLLFLQKTTKAQKREIFLEYPWSVVKNAFPGKLENPHHLIYYHYNHLLHPTNTTMSDDHAVFANTKYEWGWQVSDKCENGEMYYWKFFNICMIDYDDIDLKTLLSKLEPWIDKFCFTIYETYAGYHVYITSEYIDYSVAFKLMLFLGSDIWYAHFCRKRGYKIRMNAKMHRNELFVEKWLCHYGNPFPLPKILQSLALKDSKINKNPLKETTSPWKKHESRRFGTISRFA